MLRWRATTPLLLLALLAGCGSGDKGPTDNDMIGEVVADVSDASFDPDRMAAMFTVGNAPDEQQRKQYPIYMYRVRSVEIQGEYATAMVEIEHGTSGEILGEFEWKLTREGETWKLSAAPLPAP